MQGGKTFFVDKPELIVTIPENEVFNSKKNQLQTALKHLLVLLQIHFNECCIVHILQKKKRYLSMMVHADKDQDAKLSIPQLDKRI